jgi:hypothetical protein
VLLLQLQACRPQLGRHDNSALKFHHTSTVNQYVKAALVKGFVTTLL